jgi:hypothetical protein
MWNDPHSIMQYAMVIRFVMILAIALLGLSVGALTLMLRQWLLPQRSGAGSLARSPGPTMLEHH